MIDPSFILISDPRIFSVPVKECHEPLVDMALENVTISLARSSYYSGYTLVRISVAEKLRAAASLLPAGFRFLFSEGHRPVQLQKQMYEEYRAHLALSNPDWDREQLDSETTKYIASPLDVPPHSTGGAIDITLLDAAGKELDMGSILDDLPDRNENRHFTAANNITAVAAQNRRILIDALTPVGFVNYPAEWWHWSYGDKYWAYHRGHPHALYGSIVAK